MMYDHRSVYSSGRETIADAIRLVGLWGSGLGGMFVLGLSASFLAHDAISSLSLLAKIAYVGLLILEIPVLLLVCYLAVDLLIIRTIYSGILATSLEAEDPEFKEFSRNLGTTKKSMTIRLGFAIAGTVLIMLFAVFAASTAIF